jgi:hypothetical protein
MKLKKYSSILFSLAISSAIITNNLNLWSRSRVDESKWQKLNNYYIRDIVVHKGEVIFCANEGIFNLNGKLNSKTAYCLESNDEILVAGTNQGLLVFDTTWKKIDIIQDGYPAQVKIVKCYNKQFYLGHIEGSYGITLWDSEKGIVFETDFDTYVYSIEIMNSKIYAGDGDGNIWISENMGRSFDSTVYLNNEHLRVRTIKSVDGNLYFGAGWIYKNFMKTDHYLIPTDFDSEFVATGDSGVFIMKDINNLIPFNEGLEDLRTSCLLLYGDELYCGTVSGLYKRKLNKRM